MSTEKKQFLSQSRTLPKNQTGGMILMSDQKLIKKDIKAANNYFNKSANDFDLVEEILDKFSNKPADERDFKRVIKSLTTICGPDAARLISNLLLLNDIKMLKVFVEDFGLSRSSIDRLRRIIILHGADFEASYYSFFEPEDWATFASKLILDKKEIIQIFIKRKDGKEYTIKGDTRSISHLSRNILLCLLESERGKELFFYTITESIKRIKEKKEGSQKLTRKTLFYLKEIRCFINDIS